MKLHLLNRKLWLRVQERLTAPFCMQLQVRIIPNTPARPRASTLKASTALSTSTLLHQCRTSSPALSLPAACWVSHAPLRTLQTWSAQRRVRARSRGGTDLPTPKQMSRHQERVQLRFAQTKRRLQRQYSTTGSWVQPRSWGVNTRTISLGLWTQPWLGCDARLKRFNNRPNHKMRTEKDDSKEHASTIRRITK
jgi:hypothetical protein